MNGCRFIIRILSRLLDIRAVVLQTEPTHAQQEFMHLQAGAWGREAEDLQRRFEAGEIKDEQMSSECNDASFAYYRRMMRTGIVGATEEMTDDLIRRKMGLNTPGAQYEANAQFLTHTGIPALFHHLAEDAQVMGTKEVQEAVLNSLHAEELEQLYQLQDAADRAEGIAMLQQNIRGRRRHATQVSGMRPLDSGLA
ncbi:MAG: hypothetical protein WDW38_005971 [Sanguina aurantia]